MTFLKGPEHFVANAVRLTDTIADTKGPSILRAGNVELIVTENKLKIFPITQTLHLDQGDDAVGKFTVVFSSTL